MPKFDLNDPLGLSEMTAKECVICEQKDHQEDIVETLEGFAHIRCLEPQELDEAEESENNKLL